MHTEPHRLTLSDALESAWEQISQPCSSIYWKPFQGNKHQREIKYLIYAISYVFSVQCQQLQFIVKMCHYIDGRFLSLKHMARNSLFIFMLVYIILYHKVMGYNYQVKSNNIWSLHTEYMYTYIYFVGFQGISFFLFLIMLNYSFINIIWFGESRHMTSYNLNNLVLSSVVIVN